jgi:hypothetical protein
MRMNDSESTTSGLVSKQNPPFFAIFAGVQIPIDWDIDNA